jgi:hypothetical protein
LELAQRLVGGNADGERLESARLLAAAQIDVWRVRRARHLLLVKALSGYDDYCPPRSNQEFRRMLRILKEALRFEAKVGFPIPMAILFPRAKGARKFAWVICDLAQQLAALDRYEARARSRRKSALQAFDALHQPIDPDQSQDMS